MGLSLAVGITEHIHRNICSSQLAALKWNGCFAPEGELRRDLPNCPHVPTRLLKDLQREGDHWIVYIDDFRQDEEFVYEDLLVLEGTLAPEFGQLLSFYDVEGMPGTVEAQRATTARSLGEIVDGRLGRRDLPPSYHQENQCPQKK